jgi:hydrogenase maturation protease
VNRSPVVVLGLGNELFTDEGVGVVASRRLEVLDLPGVDVVDGGTLGIALLPEIADRRGVLVLDAVIADAREPGEVVVLGPHDLTRPNLLLYSAHQIGVQEALLAARLAGRAPIHVAGVGMVPFSLDTGFGITFEAEQRLGSMVDTAIEILAGWGVPVPEGSGSGPRREGPR